MDRATKQTCSVQVHNETVPDLGIIVELMRPGVAESKTGKAREQNHILQLPENSILHSSRTLCFSIS